MDARKFLKKHPQQVEKVAKAAGTTVAYFKQLAYGARTPSKQLAEDLEEASDGVLTRLELLYPPDPKKPGAGQRGSRLAGGAR